MKSELSYCYQLQPAATSGWSLKPAKLEARYCGRLGERAAIDCGTAGGREVETKKAEIQFGKWDQEDEK
jgi:hypothetical protein